MIRSPLGVRSIRKSRLRWQSSKNSSSVKRFIAGPKWSTSGEPIELVVTVAIVVFSAAFALTITASGPGWKPRSRLPYGLRRVNFCLAVGLTSAILPGCGKGDGRGKGDAARFKNELRPIFSPDRGPACRGRQKGVCTIAEVKAREPELARPAGASHHRRLARNGAVLSSLARQQLDEASLLAALSSIRSPDRLWGVLLSPALSSAFSTSIREVYCRERRPSCKAIISLLAESRPRYVKVVLLDTTLKGKLESLLQGPFRDQTQRGRTQSCPT